MVNVKNLRIGEKVDYGFHIRCIFLGENEKGLVTLKNKFGNFKKIQTSLFEKHASKCG